MDNIIGGAAGLANFKDPFKKDCIQNITMHIGRKIFKPDEIEYFANVYFKNGDTRGEQRIVGVDFADLVRKVQEFIKTK
jgi:hypothetical protein